MKRILVLATFAVLFVTGIANAKISDMTDGRKGCWISGYTVNDLFKKCSYVPVKCVTTKWENEAVITICAEEPRKEEEASQKSD